MTFGLAVFTDDQISKKHVAHIEAHITRCNVQLKLQTLIQVGEEISHLITCSVVNYTQRRPKIDKTVTDCVHILNFPAKTVLMMLA